MSRPDCAVGLFFEEWLKVEIMKQEELKKEKKKAKEERRKAKDEKRRRRREEDEKLVRHHTAHGAPSHATMDRQLSSMEVYILRECIFSM